MAESVTESSFGISVGDKKNCCNNVGTECVLVVGRVIKQCNFESACLDLTWSASNGNYNWLTRKGPTESNNTGPDSDHTTGHGECV